MRNSFLSVLLFPDISFGNETFQIFKCSIYLRVSLSWNSNSVIIHLSNLSLRVLSVKWREQRCLPFPWEFNELVCVKYFLCFSTSFLMDQHTNLYHEFIASAQYLNIVWGQISSPWEHKNVGYRESSHVSKSTNLLPVMCKKVMFTQPP